MDSIKYVQKEVSSFMIDVGDGFILTGIPNAKNPRRSWWLSKEGYIKSHYCFSTFAYGKMMQRELKEHLVAIQHYKDLFVENIIRCVP